MGKERELERGGITEQIWKVVAQKLLGNGYLILGEISLDTGVKSANIA